MGGPFRPSRRSLRPFRTMPQDGIWLISSQVPTLSFEVASRQSCLEKIQSVSSHSLDHLQTLLIPFSCPKAPDSGPPPVVQTTIRPAGSTLVRCHGGSFAANSFNPNSGKDWTVPEDGARFNPFPIAIRGTCPICMPQIISRQLRLRAFSMQSSISLHRITLGANSRRGSTARWS